MKSFGAVIKEETNKKIAYEKYLEIVQDGLIKSLPSIAVGAQKKALTLDGGGQFFILQDGEVGPFFLFLANQKSHVTNFKVIAHERIEGATSFQKLYEYLPDALAMSAVCTAGMTHKFLQTA